MEFLRSLNQEGQFSLVAFQAEIFHRIPGCPEVPGIDLELGKALYQSGAFARARMILKPHLALLDVAYRNFWAESYLLDFSHPSGLDTLKDYAETLPDDEEKRGQERSLYLTAVLFLKEDAPGALKEWSRKKSNSASAQVCPDLREPGCYLLEGFKSPSLAAGLSVVPGLGYGYAGRPGDGLFALTLVSLFYGAAAYYAHYESPARAWTLASFGAVFHVSGSFGAHRTALQYNRQRKTGFLIALHRQLFL